MSTKLKKLGAEVEKARAKWQEWEARTKELEARYREQEDTEICEVTRTYRLAPDELAKLLSMTSELIRKPASSSSQSLPKVETTSISSLTGMMMVKALSTS